MKRLLSQNRNKKTSRLISREMLRGTLSTVLPGSRQQRKIEKKDWDLKLFSKSPKSSVKWYLLLKTFS